MLYLLQYQSSSDVPPEVADTPVGARFYWEMVIVPNIALFELIPFSRAQSQNNLPSKL
jgi:hypothetical protein